MNDRQFTVLMNELTSHYRVEIDATAWNTWFDKVGGYEYAVGENAVGWILDNSEFFPTIAKFHEAAQLAKTTVLGLRELGQKEPDPDCPDCRGAMWVEVEPLVVEENVPGRTYEQWVPCQSCNPVGYQRWIETRKPPLKKPREETYEANPRQWIDAARNAIKNTDDL